MCLEKKTFKHDEATRLRESVRESLDVFDGLIDRILGHRDRHVHNAPGKSHGVSQIVSKDDPQKWASA